MHLIAGVTTSRVCTELQGPREDGLLQVRWSNHRTISQMHTDLTSSYCTGKGAFSGHLLLLLLPKAFSVNFASSANCHHIQCVFNNLIL